MPKLPETLKKPKKGKPKPKTKPKKGGKHPKYAAMGAVSLAIMSIFLALPVVAEESKGTHYYPYGALLIDRQSEVEEWSPGVTLGCEVARFPLFLLGHVDLHDILADQEDNKYAWNTTVGGAVGLYKSIEIGGIDITPSASLTLKRPSDLDRFSVGTNATLEASFDNLFTAVGIDFHDILTAEESEVYFWNQTVRVAVGWWIGRSPEDDREEAEEKPEAEEQAG